MSSGNEKMLLILGLVLISIQASQSLQWTSAVPDGLEFVRCAGDNVTFPWNYVTESDERVIVLFWFSTLNGTFASYFADRFTTSSGRVTHLGNAGITLADVSNEDDDTYGISVRLYGQKEPVMQHATLRVADPPKTTTGEIQITTHIDDTLYTANTSCGGHMRLKCGKFLSLGSPAVSVIWTDPAGNQFPSTSYAHGFFHLDLPAHTKAGNYTCSLDGESEAAKCIPNDSPLLRGASVDLETMETTIAGQTEDLRELRLETDAMADKLDSLLNSTLSLQQTVNNQNNGAIEDLLQRLADLEKTNKQLQQTTEEQNVNISSLQEQVAKFQRQTNKEQNVKIANLREQLATFQSQMDTLSGAVSNQTLILHQAVKTQQQHLEPRVDDLQNSLSSVTTQLSELSTSQQKSYSDLKERTDDLQFQQNNLTEIVQTDTQTLRGLVDDQVKNLKDNSDQEEQVHQRLSEADQGFRNDLNVLRADLQALAKRLQTEESTRESSTTGLQARMNEMQQTLAEQKQGVSSVESLQASVRSLQSGASRMDTAISSLQTLKSKAAFHTYLPSKDVSPSRPIVFTLVGDVGGGYNTATGVYTAPFSGWYVFQVQLFPHTSSDSDIWMDLLRNNLIIARAACNQRTSGSFTCRTGLTVHLKAGDRLWVQSFYGGPYWVATFDNLFSGVLVTPD